MLNEIDNRERRHDLMKDLAQSIPYQLVVEHRCQQMYWMAMLELAARRIVRLDLFVGIKCLTLEGYMEEEDMEVLVKSLWKDLEGEFRLLPASTLEEYFTQVAKTRQ